MASYNRVVLLGNLTRDPELRYTPSGTAVTEVGLAVNDRRKNATGEWVEETTFVDVTLWGRTAEVASEYLNKGSSVLLEGRLKLDTWEKDGKKNSKLRVVGERMQMLGGRGGGGGGGAGGGGGGRVAQTPRHEPAVGAAHDDADSGPPDDDIPF
jgi:single-strand DNA-binding protein